MVEVLLFIYENGTMRPTETSEKGGGLKIKEKDEGVNLTKIYCNHFCKCHKVPWYKYNIINFKKVKMDYVKIFKAVVCH
jgi:hypothetical protein